MTSVADLFDLAPEAIAMTGYDDCIIGIGRSATGSDVLVYDMTKVIDKLMAQGMTWEAAWEYHEFNQAGAYVGPDGPFFIDMMVDE